MHAVAVETPNFQNHFSVNSVPFGGSWNGTKTEKNHIPSWALLYTFLNTSVIEASSHCPDLIDRNHTEFMQK